MVIFRAGSKLRSGSLVNFETGKRATTLEDMRARSAMMQSAEGEAYGRRFRPRRGDVIISPYAKSGTTWMQQIVHSLRTNGDMDFPEITAAVPWIEMAHVMGIDLEAPQAAAPRAFKSHYNWHEMPKGARYIYVVRDPNAVAVSHYHFLEGWFFEPGSIALDVYIRDHIVALGRYWNHLLSWWDQRHNPDVLFLCFEEMIADADTSIRRVAEFIGCDGEAAIATTKRQSTLSFMSRHERQFDDHLLCQARDAACGLPADSNASKVRGEGSPRQHLSTGDRDLLRATWQEKITPALGLADYDALRDALAEGR